MSILDGVRSVRGGVRLLSDIHLHPVAAAATGWSSTSNAARPRVLGRDDVIAASATTDPALWSRTYRDALSCTGITVPAAALRLEKHVATVKRSGHCIAVHSGEELTLALAAGIAPRRVVMHDDGVNAGPIRRAVMAGAGRFVVGCSGQIAVLASCSRVPQWVLVDMTKDDLRAIDAVLASPRLHLLGLHIQLPSQNPTVQCYAEAIGALIAQMAHIRREHGVLLTRVSVAGAGALAPRPLTRRSLAPLNSAIEDAVDDGCARHRFPRPVLVLSPAM